ncbi:Rrf2 family transcriptional regulator [Halalkalibacter oceani]|uniref:Rrf2 family transcriptional regulator n=1 Tax=Halalkalibacter oceani TaxID=1653776 RepID=A0A9X2DM91_9BACI|nr:Rrf2 family transcriptional regulator [Halalkalibacter oceani]MCM3713349.1 Rrf2 family transcriptional regulator [Halalkalibacter oceani]
MKYSKATNYALHTIVYLALLPAGKTIGVKPLAEVQRVSPSYLSKVLTTLVKGGFIESVTGVNGGYRLIKDSKQVTFLDIIHAIEGSNSMFNCHVEHRPEEQKGCLIEAVMNEAEQKMEQHLSSRTIEDIVKKVDQSMVDSLHAVVL